MLNAAPAIKPKFSRLFVIDFETFYSKDYGLKKYTTSAYVRDAQFQVIGVGVLDCLSGEKTWLEEADFLKWKATVDWSDAAIIAHHAHFDGLILAHHFGIVPAFWFDTLSMANLLGLNAMVGGSLAKLMTHFGVGQKGTEVHEALGKHREDFTPEEWARYGGYCLNDCYGTFAIWQKMEPAVPPIEAAVVDFTVRAFTEPTLRMDTALLQEALATELKRKEDLLSRAFSDREELMSNPRFAEALLKLGVDPPMKTSLRTGKETFAFAKSDPGMKALLEHPRDEVRWLAEARVGVKSTIAESRIGRMLKLVEGDRAAPIYLKVAAAHTQRWGGGDKTNFQNLPRKGPLRQALMAPPGHVIVACDSAQIEARGLAWLAGQEDLLESFRLNRDVYSEFASVAYGRKVDRKKNPDDEVPGFVGKVCVLGLGYGMGWRKLAATLLAGAMGGPPVKFTKADAEKLAVDTEAFATKFQDALEEFPSRLGFDELAIHCAVSKLLVDRYRGKNDRIAECWDNASEVIKMMDSPASVGVRFGPGDAFKVERHAILRPSGLRLHYPGLSDRDDDGSYTYMGGGAGKEVTKIYGGLLTENMVQAFCRDIVAEQAAFLRWNYGYRIVTTTHDEVVICVPEAEGEEAMKRMVEVMRLSPAWCSTLPLNAEAGLAKRYGEC